MRRLSVMRRPLGAIRLPAAVRMLTAHVAPARRLLAPAVRAPYLAAPGFRVVLSYRHASTLATPTPEQKRRSVITTRQFRLSIAGPSVASLL